MPKGVDDRLVEGERAVHSDRPEAHLRAGWDGELAYQDGAHLAAERVGERATHGDATAWQREHERAGVEGGRDPLGERPAGIEAVGVGNARPGGGRADVERVGGAWTIPTGPLARAATGARPTGRAPTTYPERMAGLVDVGCPTADHTSSSLLVNSIRHADSTPSI